MNAGTGRVVLYPLKVFLLTLTHTHGHPATSHRYDFDSPSDFNSPLSPKVM